MTSAKFWVFYPYSFLLGLLKKDPPTLSLTVWTSYINHPLRLKGVDGCKPCGTQTPQTPSYQKQVGSASPLSPSQSGWNKDVVRLAHGDGLPIHLKLERRFGVY